MKEFMQTYRIFLTPISPIHIGCGEEFEPTNYVIDDQVLYHFNASDLFLSEKQRVELLNKINALNLLAIQRFFLENKQQAVTFSHYFANVSQGVATEWKSKLGKVVQYEEDKEIIAKLAIERTAYLPCQNEPYIPGSSFKGALATALLDAEHQKRGNPKGQKYKELLKNYLGEFSDSQLRSVKFSDFMPVTTTYSQIYYAVNYSKDAAKNNKGNGIDSRRECILAGQYRSYISELALWENKDNSRSIKDYFSQLNTFYKPIFEAECEFLVANRHISQQWVQQIRRLLANNSVALIRLGKNGADSKVLQGRNIAQIKIMKGKGKPSDCLDRSTTVWLAANQKSQTMELLPFGWALLEIDNGSENETLKSWCDSQLTQSDIFNKVEFLRNREARLIEEEAKQQAEQQEQAAKLAEQQAQAAAEQQRLASLSEKALVVEEFIQRHQNAEVKAHTDSAMFREAKLLIEQALNENWDSADKHYLFEAIQLEHSILKEKVKVNSDKAKKEFNKLRNKLMV